MWIILHKYSKNVDNNPHLINKKFNVPPLRNKCSSYVNIKIS